jgi:phenylpropionate dioxygenase-like ring-hydroxylating dioxygenase large terminal subunit
VKINHELGEGRTQLPKIRIRSYPMRSKYGFLWIFPGDPALADSVPLPSIPVLDAERPWPFVPIDITIQAHHSMIVENVCDFNHEYLHRKFKPFTRPHLEGFNRDGDTIHIHYRADHGRGQLARIAADREAGLGSIHLWYQYPYQGSDISGKYLHWLFMLPIDEETTRCFFVFLFGPIEVPVVRFNIPMGVRRPLLRLINKLYVLPLLREDQWALEEEQRAHRSHAGRGSVELNPIIRAFQQMSLEKWEEYLRSGKGVGAA